MANTQRPPPKPKALELQIDLSDSQLPFYKKTFDQDFGVSLDQRTAPLAFHSVFLLDPFLALPYILSLETPVLIRKGLVSIRKTEKLWQRIELKSLIFSVAYIVDSEDLR